MTDIWDEKPKIVGRKRSLGGSYRIYKVKQMDAWLEKLKVEYDLLAEHSGRWLHFLAVDYPEIKVSLSPEKLMELNEKAEKFDILDGLRFEYHYEAQDDPIFTLGRLLNILKQQKLKSKPSILFSRR